ncbi:MULTISPECIES: DUF3885 domain-containing protein [Bacillales]|uniref:DUF3885 domain-containing protein n=1 Tax=Lysinibacillus halotolerans TaxID=1368476 RepID=A0A3M8HDR8_9BACI|nr:DUF3885 domain-containing protein [Lysinibacillus halotolerans]RND00395.1 DUF3885 domain-containing protein [Lysinibacillus halotolerans]
MELKQIMDKHYSSLSLTPDFYRQWNMGIHLELGNDIYQFDDNNRINIDMFHAVYKQVSEIVPILFSKTDDVLLVVNAYPKETNKVVYPNFFKRFVKEQKLKYSLRLHEFQSQYDEDHLFVQQMTLYCKVSDLKLEYLLKTIIHEDFQSLQPRLRRTHCVFAPDVFLINVQTKCIFHLYDDRGCEMINADKNIHEKLLETFSGWDLHAKP